MTGQRILITGAGRRIGKALALGLGERGHSIAVHFRTSEKQAKEVSKNINSQGGKAEIIQADLTDHKAREGLIGSASKALGGPVTVLINNAASFVRDDLAGMTPSTYEKNFSTNLEGPLFLAQAFAKALSKGEKGNIVNMIDQRVLKVSKDFLTYTLSKHALSSLTRILALELAPKIRVNGICPGPSLKNAFQTDDDFENEVAGVPLGKGPTLDEFANAVDFILSTPSLTGQLIALDGGQHLR